MAFWINIYGCQSCPSLTICVVNQLKNDLNSAMSKYSIQFTIARVTIDNLPPIIFR